MTNILYKDVMWYLTRPTNRKIFISVKLANSGMKYLLKLKLFKIK